MPSMVESIQMNSEFLNNFNVMLVISVCVISAFLASYLIGKYNKMPKLEYYSINLLKQSIISFALFNALNIGFSIGVHFKYASPDKFSIMHFFSTVVLVLVALSLVSVLIILQILSKSSFGEFKDKFKNSWVNQNYVSFLLLSRIVLGIYLSY